MRGILRIVPLLAVGIPAWPQIIANGGIENAASFAAGQPITAGSLVSVFGSSLAAGLAQASSIPLSTSLGDVQAVMFNNIPAPLVFVSPAQINAQVPWEVAGAASVSVMVKNGTGTSTPAAVAASQFSPGIFSVNFGSGPAIAINSDGSLAAPSGSIPGLATHPAKAGDTLEVLCTGLGAVDNPVATGAAPTQLTHTLTTPVVMIGGMQAQVAFSGLSPQFPGVNQLNIVVPAGAPTGDAIPLQIQMGGITTSSQVTIAISGN